MNKKAGKPSPYTGREHQLVEAICDRLKAGEPLASILRENRFPDHQTLLNWREKFPEINSSISRAREVGFDVIAAECLAIADETSNDTIETKAGSVANSEWIQRSRLRVETRLKLLSKWDPKRYGDTEAKSTTVNVGVAVNVLTEEKRQQLATKKREAIERRRTVKLLPEKPRL